ncbi:MAG: hypothetical protein ACREMA_19210, partial [Longimicrobiales bacterium]
MRAPLILTIMAATMLPGSAMAQSAPRLNPIIELLEQKKPVFGLYAPRNPRARAGDPANAQPAKTVAQLALDALGYTAGDFVFDGSMEGDFDRSYPAYAEFVKAMADGGALQKKPGSRLHHPLMVKTPEIAPDPARAAERVARQLNLGTSGIVFVSVESA